MLNIRIWYDTYNFKENVPDALVNKSTKCDKVVGYELENQTVKYVITVFQKCGVLAYCYILDH